MSLTFDALRFKKKIQKTLAHLKQILDNNKNVVLVEDRKHSYEDKYQLCEFVTNLSLASQLTCFVNLGVSPDNIKLLRSWARFHAISFRFTVEESCQFVKKVKRKYDSDNKLIVESSFGNWTALVTSTVKEYKWKFSVRYSLVAFRGTGENSLDYISIQTRSSSRDIYTRSEKINRPEVCIHPPKDVDITWIFQQLEGADSEPVLPIFRINREVDACRTPRRNHEINGAIEFFHRFSEWCDQVISYFNVELVPLEEPPERTHSMPLDMSSINSDALFVPALPIVFNDNVNANLIELSSGDSLPVPPTLFLQVTDTNDCLRREQSLLQEKFSQLSSAFPAPSETACLISSAEAILLIILLHAKDIIEQYEESINYIEDLLRTQLVTAIGKVVKPSDLAAYMRYHNTRLFSPPYQPKPFSYSVRRSCEHAVDGLIGIEEKLNPDSISEPIRTLVRVSTGSEVTPMQISLNSSTSVTINGSRYLHGYLCHQFRHEEGSGPVHSLRAEARQFSAFIVLIGRITSATTFAPKHAFMVKDRGSVNIPLDFETIPSAKEFNDAIASLSPEQQRFAKAFRSLQLESTLFGVCVIQIKPQLERVLNLPPDSLTKEIELTQELLDLFFTYQIPSDLLSYSGPHDVSLCDKIWAVKKYVSEMRQMIGSCTDKEMKEKKQEMVYAIGREVTDDRSIVSVLPRAEEHSKSSRRLSLKGAIRQITQDRTRGPPSANVVDKKQQSAPAPPVSSTGKGVVLAGQQACDQHEQFQMFGNPSSERLTDLTTLPQLLDSRLERLDKEGAVRPTIVTTGLAWEKTSYTSLLAEPTTSTLHAENQMKEKSAVFDLLDALTKSGGIPVDCASLHVIVAATHCFDKSLMDTVIENNINPIEKIERSSLILASVVHNNAQIEVMVNPDQVARVLTYSPQLLRLEE